MGLLNPLGLLNNDPSKLVRVEEVPSGLACNCFCAKCGSPFEAVHPKSKRKHFRHHQTVDCQGSFESAVHLLAKKVLVQNKCLMLPYLKVQPSKSLWQLGTRVMQEELVVERKLWHFESVKDEVRMDGRIPDIVMWKGERKLLVEIFVTHDITEEKLEWIRERDLATIRVDLSWADYDITENLLVKSLRDGRRVNTTLRTNIVRWVHHPWEKAAQERVNADYLHSIAESLGMGENGVVTPVKGKTETQLGLFQDR